MRFSDVKEKHIYNVIFDPVRQCEFNLTHLAVVLKKNNDKKTCIVMPLTSESNGVGVNKIDIGCVSTLPTSLRGNNTYAVFNQVRTVNVNRFITLKEVISGINTPIECPVNDNIFDVLLQNAISDLTFAYSVDEKMALYQKLYEKEKMNKCIRIAYNIKKMGTQTPKSEKSSLLSELRELLGDSNYSLSAVDSANGIQDIFNEAKGVDK